MSSPTVSVVVPTRNRSGLLMMTLRSVLGQRGVPLEAIVVDDASSDDTPAALAAIGDERLRVIRHDTRAGVSAARNRGVEDAQGEWLAFIDDDDLWAPEKLARQIEAARDARRDWAYTGAVNILNNRIVSARRPPPPDDVVAALPHYNPIPGGGSNVVIRRPAWQQVGPFDARLNSAEDWEMSIRLARYGIPAWVCQPLVARRLHAGNLTADVAEVVRVTRLIESTHHTKVEWGRIRRWMAHSCLRAGQRRAALGQFARAAAHGEFRAVASDLYTILRSRVFGVTAPAATGASSAERAWVATAAAWLEEITGTSWLELPGA